MAQFVVFVCYLILFLYLAWQDWQTHRIPHAVTFPAIVIAWVMHCYLPATTLLNGIVGGLFLFLLFWAIEQIAHSVYGRSALGFGDVILAGMIGSVGGLVWGSWGIALGMLLGGVAALIGLMTGHWQRDSLIPYGTFLAIGMIVVLLYWLPLP